MRILVIHEVSYTKKVVYEYQDFAERLAARGHAVSVMDFDEAGDAEHRTRACSRTGLGEVTLETTPYRNVPLLKYLSGRLHHARLLEGKLGRDEVDVVFLYSVFVNGTNTVRLCRRRGVPVVYRVLDVYHRIRRNPLAVLPLYLGERFIYRNADIVCVTNQKMLRYAEGVAGGRGLRESAILHHGVDTAFFSVRERDEALARALGIAPEDRVALFLGTLYAFSGLDAIVERFSLLRERCARAKLVVVGGGELLGPLGDLVARRGLERDVVLTGFRPYDEVPRLLSLADVCFNSFYLNDITRDIVPIKMLQYMACGKPVLCAPIPDVMALFPEERSGMLYLPIEAPDEYVRALGDLLADGGRARRLGDAARAFIEAGFSIDGRVDELERLLARAAGRKGRREA